MRPLMNRIDARFRTLREQGEKGLIIYIGAGDPDLRATEELTLAFERAGADVIELGAPFSDPLADGPVNQLAAQRGLASGTTPRKVLETVASIRKRSQIPIVLYLYYNLVHRFGQETFIRQAAASGVDGLLILDLPPEEAEEYDRLMRAADLRPIYLVAPTTPEERIARIVRRAAGFIYYVSREGVTGRRTAIGKQIEERVALIRRFTDLPVAVGFGIAAPEQAKQVAAFADAAVVGSAVVDRIGRLGRSPELVPQTAAFVRSLAEAIKGGAAPFPGSNAPAAETRKP